ncbi:GAF domain-containing protein [Pseudomonas sp. CC6-YY-74]|uniref:GAF domain-containing protein n=1 Tax=Pseudomonas sp. CC6-YY-74 TaxID=1930532 RepID=UPI0009A1D92F|nr:GAF domain-containing protein [Pseudomonas sp. CC6-YY-74]
MTSENYARRLIQSVQELSLARHLDAIAPVVRHAARELVGGLGRHQPLVEGQRFALQACISGWSMLNRQAAVIEDIYLDPRIPHAAYRPTLVKSLVMVPIRAPEPIGAIGAYWARQHRASAAEVEMLQALADSTSAALENIQVYAELERRVEERTAQLAKASQRLHVEIAERERAE